MPSSAVSSASASTRRPRAFGRTSNIWQYVETVQERTTPQTHGESSLGRRKSSLMSAFSEDDGGHNPGFEDPSADHGGHTLHLGDDALHQRPLGRLEPMIHAPASSATTALTTTSSSQMRPHGSVATLKNVRSLPELAHPAPGTLTKKASLGPAPPSTMAATASAAAHGKKKYASVNAGEVVRRIQALGTSASAPYLATGTVGPATGASTTASSTVANAAVVGCSATAAGASNNAPLAAAPTSATGPATATPASLASPRSDADSFRNDFNSQPCRLYYGCSVALELFNGHVLMVSAPDGGVGVRALDKMQLRGANGAPGRHRVVLTLLDLTDVRSANTIRYGDAVWLQLSVGPGEATWEQGGVLGAKVREAPQLKALALADDDSIRNDVQAPLVVGHPVPIKAYLPKNRDDADAQVDEMQARVRNKSSKMLGKWIVRSALQQHRRKQSDNFVYNNDEIYLEQDWFYLGADSDAGVAVLRQLPHASGSTKDAKAGEYVVERRGAWRVRLLDSSNGGTGLSLAQQQMERLLLRAKNQLKHSRKMRAGQTKSYGSGLAIGAGTAGVPPRSAASEIQGGAGFVTQLRAQLVTSTRACDAQYMSEQERRLSQLPAHFTQRADAMNAQIADAGMLVPTDFGDSTATVAEATNSSRSLLAEGSALDAATAAKLSARPSSGSPTLQRRTSATESQTAPSATGPTAGEICGLCRASSVGYNLCSHIHHVMRALQVEIEQASERLAAGTSIVAASSGVAGSSGHGRGKEMASSTAAAMAADRATPDKLRKKSGHESTAIAAASSASASGSSTGSTPPSTVSHSRISQLLAQQDQHLLDIIKFKEKAAAAALAAAEQARVGLSPVAAQYRDRFKHVDQLAQQHEQSTGNPQATPTDQEQHGIGGHFQKIHAELKRQETMHRESFKAANAPSRVQQLLDRLEEDADDNDDVSVLLDTRVCPVEHPGDGFDVFGEPIDAALLERARVERLFPNEHELELLPPVDTKVALELYLQNKAAVVEMLDGFVDLVQTHIVPNLASAMATRHRGAVVEFLDFTARAAEFVCARRIQVRVAQLLHVISESDVGEFERFQREYEQLLAEFDGTTAFIRFYREKVGKKGKKNR